MPRKRLSTALYLLLVFASGALVGVVSHRLYATTSASANTAPRSMSEFRQRYLAGMREKVGASEPQIAEIVKVLDETKHKLDTLQAQEKPLHDKIQQEHVDAIKAILNDKQQVAYDNWRTEREKARAAAAALARK